jgi:hypothetical protein
MASAAPNPATTRCRLCGAPATVSVLYFNLTNVRACSYCATLPLHEWTWRLDHADM